jgi:hypothetical protein
MSGMSNYIMQEILMLACRRICKYNGDFSKMVHVQERQVSIEQILL